MSWLEEKYVGLISARLEKFKRKGNTYNFRCFVCGDSQKDKNKARGYLYQKKNEFVFHCHNCNISLKFKSFLRRLDPVLADEYSKEAFVESKGFTQAPVVAPPITSFVKPKFQTNSPLKGLKRVSQLDPSHPAKLYVQRREIPSNFHYKLFYTPKFKTWVNTLIPQKFAHPENDEPRLIIPFLDRDGELYGFQGRSFKKDGLRYITIMLDESKPKIFGLDSVDFKKQIYIFEGPIDSMFIPNSMAMAGADMFQAQQLLKLDTSNCVIVMDNEPRNEQIVKRIETNITMGFNVCIWPQNIQEKDVNDMVLSGIKPADLQLIIKQHTYSGLAAQMALAAWRKC